MKKAFFVSMFILLALILIAVNTFFGTTPLIETYDGTIVGLSVQYGFFVNNYQAFVQSATGPTYVVKIAKEDYVRLKLNSTAMIRVYHFKGAIIGKVLKVRAVVFEGENKQRACSLL